MGYDGQVSVYGYCVFYELFRLMEPFIVFTDLSLGFSEFKEFNFLVLHMNLKFSPVLSFLVL